MCGIAGVLSKTGRAVDQGVIPGMLSFLERRGPDAKGTWNSGVLSFGHCRLKVLDLSDAANQPFTDGKDALVYNGEIFNYKEIREKLAERHAFKTRSDTEVLFRALQEWGEEAILQLDGQFAFAFYSASRNSLLLARDYAGICPLYIMDTEDGFYFASEIKPLLSLGRVSLDRQGVVDYFFYRYNIQNGRTLFQGIKRFPPAHLLEINLATGEKLEKRYWRLKFSENRLPHEDIQSQFNGLLDREISLQRLADVPVGLYLSGGIDSGALLAGYAKGDSDINAFTLSFSQDDADAARVKRLAKRYNFNANRISFSENDFSSLEDGIFSLEEPFGDLIICANYLLAEKASRGLKVVLSGEGGDESFCGYDHQRAFVKMSRLASGGASWIAVSLLLKTMPAKMIGMLNSYPGDFGREEHARIKNVFSHIKEPLAGYLSLVSLFSEEELASLLTEDFKKNSPLQADTLPIKEIFDKEEKPWRAVMRAEIEQLTLIINLLKQDRFAMRFSMEPRVPLISRKILDFCGNLSFEELYGSENKRLLLDYAGRKCIAKKPFSLLADRVYSDSVKTLWDKYVTRESVSESKVISWEAAQGLACRLRSGNILSTKKAMAVLVFMAWFRSFKKYLK